MIASSKSSRASSGSSQDVGTGGVSCHLNHASRASGLTVVTAFLSVNEVVMPLE